MGRAMREGQQMSGLNKLETCSLISCWLKIRLPIFPVSDVAGCGMSPLGLVWRGIYEGNQGWRDIFHGRCGLLEAWLGFAGYIFGATFLKKENDLIIFPWHVRLLDFHKVLGALAPNSCFIVA